VWRVGGTRRTVGVVLAALAACALTAPPAGAQSGGRWTSIEVGGPQTFVVPDGVYFLTVDAQGGTGSANEDTGSGGRGGGVRTTFPVTPGERLDVWVGGWGGDHGGGGWGGTGGDHGTANGVINQCHHGGAGGGASAVLRGSTPLVVAGGGGGGGGDCPHLGGGAGGAGGNPPEAGRDSAEAEPPHDGIGGAVGAAWGTGGQGGHDADFDQQGGGGGGGGAGHPDGGGGGWDGVISWKTSGVGGGGGAGGGSHADPSGMIAHPFFTSGLYGDGAVELTWGGTAHRITPISGGGATRIGTAFPAPVRVKVTTAEDIPLTGLPVTFTAPERGPSGRFHGSGASATVPTGPDGVATAPPLTADAVAGRWSLEIRADDVKTHVALVNEAAPTVTAVAATANPAVSGEPVTFTARVRAAGTPDPPTGSVQFSIDGAPAGERVPLEPDGTATSPAFDALTPGDHAVRAAYAGDDGHEASAATLTQRVDKATSALTLSSSLNPSGSGDEVVFTARVALQPPARGEPTGSVQFRVDGAPLGAPADLDASGAVTSPVVSDLAQGRHEVTAAYAGDARTLAADAVLTQTVGEEAAAVELSASVDPAAYGQAVVATATVRRRDPGTVPTGSVVFRLDGAEVCGPTELVDGSATCTLPPVLPGVHALQAAYHSDDGVEDAVGAAIVRVVAAPTAMTLEPEPEPSTVGAPVRLRATVATRPPAAGTPTGAVRFFVDGAPLGAPVELIDGVATSPPADALSWGAHVVEADYADDAAIARFTASHAATVQRVLAGATETSLSSDADPSPAGAAVAFTARVAVPDAAVAPTGMVEFLLDGRPLGAPVALDGGTARSDPTPPLLAGAYTVAARYHGAAGFLPSAGEIVQVAASGGAGGGGGGPSGGGGGASPSAIPAPLGLEPPPRAEIATSRARVDRRGTLGLALRCIGPAQRRCAGRLQLDAARPGAARPVRLGARTVSIPGGETRRVAVDLDRSGERAVSSTRTLHARAAFVTADGFGGAVRAVRLRSARAPALRVAARRAVARAGGRIALAVRCVAPRTRRCDGSVALRAGGHELARGEVWLRGGRRGIARLALTSAGRARLVAGPARARAVSRIPVGRDTTRRRTVRVVVP